MLNLQNYFWNPYAIPYFTVGLLTLLEGLFILVQNRRSLVNFSYMLACLSVMLWLVGLGAIYSSLNEPAALTWAKYVSFLGIIFITPTIHFFSVCWRASAPTFKGIRSSWPSILLNLFCGLALYSLCVSTNLLINGLWHYRWGFYPKAGAAYFLLIVWFFIIMSLAIKNFVYAYKMEQVPIKKKQAKLIVAAFSVAFIGSIEYLPNYGMPLYLIAFIPVFTCITIVGYSIIRYRLMDIETVVHKTIAWLFTNAALVAPFVILFYFILPWYKGLNIFGGLIFSVVLLMFFLFFVKIFQPKIDHFFQRGQYDLEEISTKFTEDLVHLKGISQLVRRIEETIMQTLYPQRTAILIYNETKKNYRLSNADGAPAQGFAVDIDSGFADWLIKNNKIIQRDFIDIDPVYAPIKEAAARHFGLTEALVTVPLVLNEKLLGLINLSKKANLKRYSAADFIFLNILKNQSAIAISNSLLYENMEEQVRQRTKELVDVQKQLVQAEKLATVGTLAGGVAHEINNPLAAILTNVQMLLSADTRDAEFDRESLEMIEEATKRCRTIVQKLMAYARRPMEAADITEVDLSAVANNTIAFLRYQLEQENIHIAVNARNEKYAVTASHNELEQVITNIVLNARDAIKLVKRIGLIDITLSQTHDWVGIQVKDNGIGMTKEVMGRIFDPFFTTKDVGKGLGLGLSICQSIVEKYNGRISVSSEPNKGSLFTIELPRAKIVAGDTG
jgi:signal transduction histidine kinase